MTKEVLIVGRFYHEGPIRFVAEDLRDQNVLLLNFLLSLLCEVLKYLERKRQRKLEEAN